MIDNIRDREKTKWMSYCEFLVFVSRLALENYSDASQVEVAMHQKIDKLLPVLLQPANMTPQFVLAKE